MKFKSIMIISILFAVLTIGTASACDMNMTANNLATDIQEPVDTSFNQNEIIGDDSIGEHEMFNITAPSEVYVLTPFEVTFTGSDDLNGEIETHDSGDDFYANSFENVVNGKAVMNLSFSRSGMHKVIYEFNNDDGTRYSSSLNVNALSLFDVAPKSAYAGNTVTVTFTGPGNLNGEIYLDVENEDGIAYVPIKNGKGSASLKVPNAKSISYRFHSSIDESFFYGILDINIVKKPTIKASDFKKTFSSKKKYQVRVLDSSNKPVAGKKITFQLYDGNKKVAEKTSTTDKNGYAKVDFNVASGNYKVKIKYGSATVTKKYAVNSIIKIKEAYKKNSKYKYVTSKKLVIAAYLKKVDGKVLKGKKVKFTFYKQSNNGYSKMKSFTAKTSSKGLATLSFKKTPVNIPQSHMKMGMGYMIKVSYGKDYYNAAFVLYSKNPFRYVYC